MCRYLMDQQCVSRLASTRFFLMSPSSSSSNSALGNLISVRHSNRFSLILIPGAERGTREMFYCFTPTEAMQAGRPIHRGLCDKSFSPVR